MLQRTRSQLPHQRSYRLLKNKINRVGFQGQAYLGFWIPRQACGSRFYCFNSWFFFLRFWLISFLLFIYLLLCINFLFKFKLICSILFLKLFSSYFSNNSYFFYFIMLKRDSCNFFLNIFLSYFIYKKLYFHEIFIKIKIICSWKVEIIFKIK